MPIYEYQCEKCQNTFEELVFVDDQEVSCPACGATRTKKLMSCCQAKVGGAGSIGQAASPTSSSSGCAGCSGGNCASCG